MNVISHLRPLCKTSHTLACRLAIVTISVLSIYGCAINTPTSSENIWKARDDSVLGTPRDIPSVDKVFLNQAHLWLSYTSSGEQVYASATLEPISERLLAAAGKSMPVRVLIPVAHDAVRAANAGRKPVKVLAPEAWQALLDASLHTLTPVEDGYGAVVDILQEDELFLYRLRGDALAVVPVIFKPPDVQVQQTYTFADLLDVIRRRLVADYPAAGKLLFETGDNSKYGYPFVYADADSGEILFLRHMPDDGRSGSMRFGTTLEVFTHTLVDHVRALFNQPVSSVSRLFTMVSTTTLDLARPTPLVLLEHEPIPPLNSGDGMDLAQWEAELDLITGTASSTGRLTYRIGGAEFFPRLIDLVGAAEESVYLRVYIFDNDDYATDFADLLKRRSSDVDIRVLVDGLGTRGAKMATSSSIPPDHKPEFSIIHYLEQDSEVRVRTVPNIWLTGDHTKTILIDGKAAFLGGMNIGREYRYDWHDMMVEIEGPVVSEITREFRRAWISSGLLGDLRKVFYQDTVDAIPASETDYPVRLLHTRPGDSEILRAQIAATRQARRNIFLENPYITSDAMLYELVKARRRGVDVRVIMPYRSDSGLITRSNVLAANAMLRNGIRVYISPWMSHLKAAIYDGWACLGSANMDNLSLRTNREMNLTTSHSPAVDVLYERVFAPDMERSVELTSPLPSNWSDYLAELLADYL